MNAKWTLRGLRYAYVAFIAAASGAALDGAREGTGHHGAHLVLALAGPELLAALAFLAEPIEIAACAVLLLVYLAAAALSVASGDWLAPLRFAYFAVTAVFIVLAHRREKALAVTA
ncbi:MAG TPA: hypothetical protein VNU97_16520 [Rhizomicrobium sp.]|jgi:hypothetical protein|nr:hypothetical protein [Rhizomicrobium sp.]